MATADELLRMQADMQAADESLMQQGYAPGEIPQEGPAGQPPVLEDPFADIADPFAEFDAPEYGPTNPLEEFPSPFPDEPGTSRASRELGEAFVPAEIPGSGVVGDIGRAIMGMPTTGEGIPMGGGAELVGPGRETPETGGGVGATLPPEQAAMIAAAAVTMTDPEEIAGMLRNLPGDPIGITYAPDGAIIATNRETNARGLINRPGASGMDLLQALGLGSLFTPAGKVASVGVKTALPAVSSATMRKQLEREAVRRATLTGAGAAGITEGVIQAGQEQAGGTYDPEDVAFTTLAGAAGERIAYPLASLAQRSPAIRGPVSEAVPKNVSQALDYAESTGRKIFTSDALGEYMTPVQQIALKSVERIPVTGIGRQRIRQKAARTDALIDLANKYDIDIESDLGQDIADNFLKRMVKHRFWGKNKEIMDPENWPSGVTKPKERKVAQARAQELLERAYQKEADEVVDAALAKQLREGNLDGEIVEKVLDQANPKRVDDLFGKLMPDGQQAVKQRFLAKGLERAGWTPDAPQIADPDGFVKYLTKPENKKMLNIMFDEGERDLIEGTREYLRLTSEAAKTGKGAGMVAAVGGSMAVAGTLLSGMIGTAALVAGAGRTIQSRPVRNLLLKLTYAKGDPEKVQRIMQQLRPAVITLQNQYMESGGPPEMPDIEFDKDMMKDLGDYGMEYLRSLGEKGMGKFEDVGQSLSKMLAD